MENDEIFIEDKVYTSDNELKKIFRFEYEEQNLKNNKGFQKWKYELEKKYGKSIRLYKCNKDKIFFYHQINDRFDSYIRECPECKKYICFFCSQIIDGPPIFAEFIGNYCCLKRLLFFIFYREKTCTHEGDPTIMYILSYVSFIIPILSSFALIMSIIQNLFCFKHYDNYIQFIKRKNYIFIMILIINLGFAFIMSIAYLNLTLIYIIFIFLISIPFKMIHLKNFLLFIVSNSVGEG